MKAEYKIFFNLNSEMSSTVQLIRAGSFFFFFLFYVGFKALPLLYCKNNSGCNILLRTRASKQTTGLISIFPKIEVKQFWGDV